MLAIIVAGINDSCVYTCSYRKDHKQVPMSMAMVNFNVTASASLTMATSF